MKNSSFNHRGVVNRLGPCAIALAGGFVGLAAGTASADTVAMSVQANVHDLASSGNAIAVFAMPMADWLASWPASRGMGLTDSSTASAPHGLVSCGLTAGTVFGGSIVAIDLSGLDPAEVPMIAQTLRDPRSPISGRPFNQFDSDQMLPITPEVELDGDVGPRVGPPPIVPLPPAAWAGLSTLALGVVVGLVRRRRIARA